MVSKSPSLKTKRPSPIHYGAISFRAIRGPNEDGYWYFAAIKRVEGKDKSILSFWSIPTSKAVIKTYNSLQAPEPAKEEPVKESYGSLASLIRRWWAAKEPRTKGRTKETYGRWVKILSKYSEDISIPPSPTDIDMLVVRLTDEYSDTTANCMLTLLGTMYRYGVVNGWATGFLTMAKPKAKPSQDKYTPSNSEMELIGYQLSGWKGYVFQVSKETGARIGEIANLRWKDIDYAQRRMVLSGKTGTRTIAMSRALIRALQSWEVTANKSEPNIWGMVPHTLDNHFNKALRKAALDAGIQRRITNHSIRRWTVGRLKRAGVDVKTAASWLGHSPKVMLTLYDETTESDLFNALSLLEK